MPSRRFSTRVAFPCSKVWRLLLPLLLLTTGLDLSASALKADLESLEERSVRTSEAGQLHRALLRREHGAVLSRLQPDELELAPILIDKASLSPRISHYNVEDDEEDKAEGDDDDDYDDPLNESAEDERLRRMSAFINATREGNEQVDKRLYDEMLARGEQRADLWMDEIPEGRVYTRLTSSNRGVAQVTWLPALDMVQSINVSSESDPNHTADKISSEHISAMATSFWMANESMASVLFHFSRQERISGLRFRQPFRFGPSPISNWTNASFSRGSPRRYTLYAGVDCHRSVGTVEDGDTTDVQNMSAPLECRWKLVSSGSLEPQSCCEYQDLLLDEDVSADAVRLELLDTYSGDFPTLTGVEFSRVMGELEGMGMPRHLECGNNSKHGWNASKYLCASQLEAMQACNDLHLTLCSAEEIAGAIGRVCRYMWTRDDDRNGYRVGNGRADCGAAGRLYSDRLNEEGLFMFDAACCVDRKKVMKPNQQMIMTLELGTYKEVGDGACVALASDDAVATLPLLDTLTLKIGFDNATSCLKLCDQEPRCGAADWCIEPLDCANECRLYSNARVYSEETEGNAVRTCWVRSGRNMDGGSVDDDTWNWRDVGSIGRDVVVSTEAVDSPAAALREDDLQSWMSVEPTAVITFEMMGTPILSGIRLKMPSDRPGSSMKDYSIATSLDGNQWNVVKMTTHPQQHCCQFQTLDFRPASGKFWKINISSNYGGDQVGIQYLEFLVKSSLLSCQSFTPDLRLEDATYESHFTSCANLGRADNGGIPFASGSSERFCAHKGAGTGVKLLPGRHCYYNINDGMTGIGSSWVPGDPYNGRHFVGVRLHKVTLVRGISISTPKDYNRHIGGWYHVQYSAQSGANHMTLDSYWCTVGSFTRARAGVVFKSFSQPVEATAIRVVVSSADILIDELFVFGDVEPLDINNGLIADLRAMQHTVGTGVWGNLATGLTSIVSPTIKFNAKGQHFHFTRGGPIIKVDVATDSGVHQNCTFVAWVKLANVVEQKAQDECFSQQDWAAETNALDEGRWVSQNVLNWQNSVTLVAMRVNFEINNLDYSVMTRIQQAELRSIIAAVGAQAASLNGSYVDSVNMSGDTYTQIAFTVLQPEEKFDDAFARMRAHGKWIGRNVTEAVQAIMGIAAATKGSLEVDDVVVSRLASCGESDLGRNKGWIVGQMPDYGNARALRFDEKGIVLTYRRDDRLSGIVRDVFLLDPGDFVESLAELKRIGKFLGSYMREKRLTLRNVFFWNKTEWRDMFDDAYANCSLLLPMSMRLTRKVSDLNDQIAEFFGKWYSASTSTSHRNNSTNLSTTTDLCFSPLMGKSSMIVVVDATVDTDLAVMRDTHLAKLLTAPVDLDISSGVPPIGEWFMVAGLWSQGGSSYSFINGQTSQEVLADNSPAAGDWYSINHVATSRCVGTSLGSSSLSVQLVCKPEDSNLALIWLNSSRGSRDWYKLLGTYDGRCLRRCSDTNNTSDVLCQGKTSSTNDGFTPVVLDNCNGSDPTQHFERHEVRGGFQIRQFLPGHLISRCLRPRYPIYRHVSELGLEDCGIDPSSLFTQSKRLKQEYLAIGGKADFDSVHNPDFFVSDVAVYDRTLSSDDLNTLYKKGRPSRPLVVNNGCQPTLDNASFLCNQLEVQPFCEYVTSLRTETCHDFCTRLNTACVGAYTDVPQGTCRKSDSFYRVDVNRVLVDGAQTIESNSSGAMHVMVSACGKIRAHSLCQCTSRFTTTTTTEALLRTEFEDFYYAVGSDRKVYKEARQLISPHSEWQEAGPCCVTSMTVVGDFFYGVDTEARVVRLPKSVVVNYEYAKQNQTSERVVKWDRVGECCVKSLLVDGEYMYAVSTDHRVLSQKFAYMTKTSSWSPAGRCCVTSIAKAGDYFYSTGTDGRVYRQRKDALLGGGRWIPVASGGMIDVKVDQDSLIGVGSDHYIYSMALKDISATSSWKLMGQCCMLSIVSAAPEFNVNLVRTTFTTTVATWRAVSMGTNPRVGGRCVNNSEASWWLPQSIQVHLLPNPNATELECRAAAHDPPTYMKWHQSEVRFYQFCESCVGLDRCSLVKECSTEEEAPPGKFKLFVNINIVCPRLWENIELLDDGDVCDGSNFVVHGEMECQERARSNDMRYYQYCENCEDGKNWCCNTKDKCSCYRGKGWLWTAFQSNYTRGDYKACTGFDWGNSLATEQWSPSAARKL